MTKQIVPATYVEVIEENSTDFLKNRFDKKLKEELEKEKIKWQQEEKQRQSQQLQQEQNQQKSRNEKLIEALFDIGIKVLEADGKSPVLASVIKGFKEPLIPFFAGL